MTVGHAVRVGEVDAEVVRRASRRAHGVDRTLRRLRPLQSRQFLFHQRRSGSLAARLDAREQIALEAFFVAHEALEVGIIRIRLRHQIEQVERAAGSGCQIGGNGRDDASRSARDQENAVSDPASGRAGRRRGLFLQSDRPAQAILVADLDCAGIAQRFLDEKFRQLPTPCARPRNRPL